MSVLCRNLAANGAASIFPEALQATPLQVLRVLRHLFAGLQPHIRLLPVRTVAGKLSPPPFFSRIGGGADRMHFHFKNTLHRFLNFRLSRRRRHLKNQRVLVLLDGETFLGDDRTPKDLVCGFHQATSAAFSCRVRRRGEREAFFGAFPSPSAGLCCRFEIELFSEICSFSIAGCEKIARS